MYLSRSSFRVVFTIALMAIDVLPGTAFASRDDPPPNAKSTKTPSKSKGKPSVDPAQPKASPTLRMSQAVACRSIDGYEQYEPLDEPALTSDEKLLVYYRPRGYKIVRRDRDYLVHFSQDGKIRRKGQKTPVRVKDRLLDVESTFKTSPDFLYLRNTVSLKDLPPGEYEFDIILRDENQPGNTATQTLPFRIIRAEAVKRDAESNKDEPPPKKETYRRR